MLLIPPILVKMSSTLWRFARYYLGAPEYRHKGPPPAALRVIGPFVMLLTVLLFASGVLLLFSPVGWRGRLLQLHQASFILWFILMAVHVLAHLGDVVRVSTKDWSRRTRGLVAGSRARRLLITLSPVSYTHLAKSPWARVTSLENEQRVTPSSSKGVIRKRREHPPRQRTCDVRRRWRRRTTWTIT